MAVIHEVEFPDQEVLHRGKVRDTFDLGEGRLLMVTTDRISAFDVVLPTAIPRKGEVLNALSAFWFKKAANIVRTHFLAAADESDVASLFGGGLLKDLPPDIAGQAMVVKQINPISVECIVRGYITGSALAEYREHGTVWGQQMPEGMVDGDPFPEPLYTPTTKATEGHDEPMTEDEVVALFDSEESAARMKAASISIYQMGRRHAVDRGIILADTKMEFGLDEEGNLVLIDELLTPDSSRFWDAATYEPGRSQSSFDKQFIRDWLNAEGWDHESPAPDLPNNVVSQTTEKYLAALRMLTGPPIED
ncbi:phosphoribosylaminoimidazolesuccinocarboxamide synthase [Patescibacteria group bacterium]|nr:phosphoribosylaminoimidazolesuccinocarboxamide synthase [Patescibacteria group bacterium]